jgi:hypothetical protein
MIAVCSDGGHWIVQVAFFEKNILKLCGHCVQVISTERLEMSIQLSVN